VPILRHAVNLFIGNYFKNSIDVFVPFTILFFAMYSLDKLSSGKKINPVFIVVSTGVLLIILHFPYFDFNNTMVNFKMKLIISLFLMLYALLLFLINSQKNRTFIKIALIVIVTLEVSYISWFSVNDRDVYMTNEMKGTMAGYKDGTIEIVDYLRQTDSTMFYRIDKDYFSGNSQHSSLNDAKAQGYFSTPSYGSFNQKYYIRFLEEVGVIQKGNEGQTRWATGVRGIPLLMTFANVKYFLTRNLENKLMFSGFDSIGYMNNILILENKYFVPFGYTYSKYIPIETFEKLTPFKKQQALLSAVVIEDKNLEHNLSILDTNSLVTVDKFNFDIYSKMIDSLKKETFKMTSFKHKHIEGEIEITQDKLLFFTIPYDKGWRIFIDGINTKYILANTGFTGFLIKKGHHKITLKYFPAYFELTLIISIISLFVLIFIIIKSIQIKKKIIQ